MSKNFMKDGKWVDNPHKVEVKTCECGNKYIKTRANQRVCLQCVSAVTKK